MSVLNMRPMLMIILAIVGMWQIGQGGYIYAKAYLAQYLIKSSWQSMLQDEHIVKPWPWADTWPVSRLTMKKHSVDLYILAGDNGRTLAFGPGYRFGSAKPGNIGNSIIAAHRDTHFNYLKDVVVGERFYLQTVDALIIEYQIVDIKISHYQNALVPVSMDKSMLTLVTCFPFDSITTGGPLRYVVIAEKISSKVLL